MLPMFCPDIWDPFEALIPPPGTIWEFVIETGCIHTWDWVLVVWVDCTRDNPGALVIFDMHNYTVFSINILDNTMNNCLNPFLLYLVHVYINKHEITFLPGHWKLSSWFTLPILVSEFLSLVANALGRHRPSTSLAPLHEKSIVFPRRNWCWLQ